MRASERYSIANLTVRLLSAQEPTMAASSSRSKTAAAAAAAGQEGEKTTPPQESSSSSSSQQQLLCSWIEATHKTVEMLDDKVRASRWVGGCYCRGCPHTYKPIALLCLPW